MTNEATVQTPPQGGPENEQADLINLLVSANNPQAGAELLMRQPRRETLPTLFRILTSPRNQQEKLNALSNIKRAVDEPAVSGLTGDPQALLDEVILDTKEAWMNPSPEALLALEKIRGKFQRAIKESRLQTLRGTNHRIFTIGVDGKVLVQALMTGLFNYAEPPEFRKAIFRTFLNSSTNPAFNDVFFGADRQYGQVDFSREREPEPLTFAERVGRSAGMVYRGDLSEVRGVARAARERRPGRRPTPTPEPTREPGQPTLVDEINRVLTETTEPNAHFEVTPEQLTNYVRTLALPAGAEMRETHAAILEERLTITGRIGIATGEASFSATLVNNPEGGLTVAEQNLNLPLFASLLRGRIENYIRDLNRVIRVQINRQINQNWETDNFSITQDRLAIDFKRRTEVAPPQPEARVARVADVAAEAPTSRRSVRGRITDISKGLFRRGGKAPAPAPVPAPEPIVEPQLAAPAVETEAPKVIAPVEPAVAGGTEAPNEDDIREVESMVREIMKKYNISAEEAKLRLKEGDF